VEALRRANAIEAANHGGPSPAEIAFLAMAHHRLGHAAEARAGLDVLRARMKDPEATKDPVSQAFLREAEVLIDPKPVGSETELRPPRG
jgi:hypothetical protein